MKDDINFIYNGILAKVKSNKFKSFTMPKEDVLILSLNLKLKESELDYKNSDLNKPSILLTQDFYSSQMKHLLWFSKDTIATKEWYYEFDLNGVQDFLIEIIPKDNQWIKKHSKNFYFFYRIINGVLVFIVL